MKLAGCEAVDGREGGRDRQMYERWCGWGKAPPILNLVSIPGGSQRVRLRPPTPAGSKVGVASGQSAVQGALRPLAAPSLPGSTATASTTAAC